MNRRGFLQLVGTAAVVLPALTWAPALPDSNLLRPGDMRRIRMYTIDNEGDYYRYDVFVDLGRNKGWHQFCVHARENHPVEGVRSTMNHYMKTHGFARRQVRRLQQPMWYPEEYV